MKVWLPKEGARAPHPSLLQRKIIHVDMDAFFAACEIQRQPELSAYPVIVGGDPNGRGVVSTCNYLARQYGVRSAMSARIAHKLCPKAIFLRPDFELYRRTSQAIREIFQRYTDLIEPLSLDEAYLDVTNAQVGMSATKIAEAIRQTIKQELRLTASAGVGPNKLIAKIASDCDKPDGLAIVLPGAVLDFMAPLPLRRIPGVGPKTEEKLKGLGLHVCSDLWRKEMTWLDQHFKSSGLWLWERSHGLSDTPVAVSRVRKSLGRERTFREDIGNPEELDARLLELVQHVQSTMETKDLRAKTITVKIKFADFTQITRSHSLEIYRRDLETFIEVSRHVLTAAVAGERRKVRLLGFSVSNFSSETEEAR